MRDRERAKLQRTAEVPGVARQCRDGDVCAMSSRPAKGESGAWETMPGSLVSTRVDARQRVAGSG